MRIFISFAAKDRELAARLSAELSHAGFAVWNPDDEIEPGDNWAKKIGEALDTSDLMVVVLTRGALESQSLRGNIQYALTSRNFEHRLIPVLVDFVTFQGGKDVPWILLKLNPVYMASASEGFDAVIGRVRAIAQQETNAAR
jgi:hypothetical protein